MARLFPFRSEPSTGEGQPRVVDLEGEDADAVFGALSSTTARRIYARLDDEPGTPSDVADSIDSSIQNVRYHLEKLEDAGLVEIVDTWYSSRGNEMSVYATTDGPLIVTSDESRASQLRTALSRLVGGIGALAGGSLLVQYGATRWLGSGGPESDEFVPTGGEDSADGGDSGDAPAGDGEGDERVESADQDGPSEEADAERDAEADGEAMTADRESEDGANGADGADIADEGDNTADETVTDTAPEEYNSANESVSPSGGGTEGTETVADGGSDPLTDGGAEAADAIFGTVPPGLLFFLGGLVVLLAVTCYWYWYRPAY
ncbi:ArsR/SmtB family transcription factor [Natronococcus wangiae]|uniref:ArsR/SmtB family transcription factor n=1 Tax=Natronococcus wangiae TaxID=3068275 RepID=UPI00273DA857|nr:helix-turn-helix domain-containing protein [Natronococcus sp. AD5]